MVARIESVNIARSLSPTSAGELGRTGIDKRPVAGRLRATRLGLTGDQIADGRSHGGVDQAVYAYSREDAQWWASELDRELPPGRFGENLSTTGVDLHSAIIGERWRVGEAELEVSFPRIPCTVFAGFWDVPDLVKRFTVRARSGAYLRVVVEGELGAGDEITVVHRPEHGVNIEQTFLAFTTQPRLLVRMVDVAALPEDKRERARRRVGTGA